MPNYQAISEATQKLREENLTFLKEIDPLRSKLLSQTAQLQNLLRKISRLQVEIKYLKKEITKNKKIISSKKEMTLKGSVILRETYLPLGLGYLAESSEIAILEQEIETVEDLLQEIEKIINLYE